MSEERPLNVFLCHSSNDKQKVRELYLRLVEDGFDIWLDDEKLLPGQNWDLEIRKAIKQADAVIICLSNASQQKKGYVQKEIHLALEIAIEQPEGAIYLIPARLEDCQISNYLSQWQWVNMFDENGYRRLYQSLIHRAKQLNLTIIESTERRTQRLKILGSIAVGIPIQSSASGDIYMNEDTDAIDIARSLLPQGVKGTDLFALKVKGDSMSDAMVNNGDIVIMKRTEQASNGDMVAIWLPERNETTLKYFYREKNGYRLQPANPSLEPIFISKDEPLEIKGKVLMVIRNAAIAHD
jgi:SOS-response transcriptional repressor LexA